MVKRLVGLDIGSTAIRAVELDDAESSQPTIVRYGEMLVPEGAVRAGEVIDSSFISTALKSLWASAGFKTKDVVLGVGDAKVLARDITVPKVPLAQIRESLPFQVQDLLAVAASDALLDFYPMTEVPGESGPMLKGMLIAAIKAPVLRNVDAVQASGLTVRDVDLIPFSLSRVFGRVADEGSGRLLLHVGATSTTLVVLVGSVPHMVRIIPSGGIDLTKGIAQRMDIAMKDAEQIKRMVGVVPANAAADQRGALEATFELVNEVLVNVRDTISYFGNAHAGQTIDRIVMSGGGSRLEGLSAAVGEFTRLPVDLTEPFGSVQTAKGLKGAGDPFSMSVALGLAMGVPA